MITWYLNIFNCILMDPIDKRCTDKDIARKKNVLESWKLKIICFYGSDLQYNKKESGYQQ